MGKRMAKIKKLVFGVGINDSGYPLSKIIEGRQVTCRPYQLWQSMLRRCYSESFQSKWPTYKGCSVCEEWLIFSSFAKWMEKQDWKGKHLDKDILKVGNKIYSPDNCIFVSPEINLLLNNSRASRGKYKQGVCLNKGKFQAKISKNGKIISLGRFQMESDASNAYKKAKSEHIINIATQQSEPLRSALIRHAEEYAKT